MIEKWHDEDGVASCTSAALTANMPPCLLHFTAASSWASRSTTSWDPPQSVRLSSLRLFFGGLPGVPSHLGSAHLFFISFPPPLASYIWLDKNDNEEVVTKTRYICEQTSAPLAPSEMKSAFKFGGEQVKKSARALASPPTPLGSLSRLMPHLFNYLTLAGPRLFSPRKKLPR